MSQSTVVYVGQDERYWNSIKAEYEKLYEGIYPVDFHTLFDINENAYGKMYRQIIELNPGIVYIDFGTGNRNMVGLLRLVKLLRRINATKHIAVIGLFEHLAPPEIKVEMLKAGILFTQLKSGEDVHDVVYDGGSYSFGDYSVEPNFFQVKVRDGHPVKIGEKYRINYIAKDHIMVEGNQVFKAGEEIELFHEIPEAVIPSQKFFVKDIVDDDHYYDFPYKIKLEYKYIDPVVRATNHTKLDRAREAEDAIKYKEDVEKAKSEIDRWVTNQVKLSKPKNSKILVIDRKLSILDQTEKWIGEFNSPIRIQNRLLDPKKELNHYLPDIIALEYDEVPEELEKGDSKDNYNDIDSIKRLIGGVNGVENYLPIVLIFNAGGKSADDFRESIGYKQVVVSNNSFSLESITKLASVHYAKNQKKTGEHGKDKFFVDKETSLSYGMFMHEISFVNVTESAVEFTSKRKLPMSSIYSTSFPADCHLTVIPHKRNSQYSSTMDCYRAIFHSFNREEKNKLRSYIISNK